MKLGIIMCLVIIAVILALGLKTKNPEISNMISVSICVLIISMSVERIKTIFNTLTNLINFLKIDESYILILIKLIGISYICEFAAGISKDAGYSAIAFQIELFGKLTMLMISLPVLVAVIETIINMLG